MNTDLKMVFTSNMVGAFGDGLFAYLLPVYMKESLGADPVQIGLLYAVMTLSAASTLLVSGTLGDKYDRKRIMVVGWLTWLPAPLIFSFAHNWTEMLPGMILWGSWLGQPASTAYIITAADRGKVIQTFTVMSAAWSMGYTFSPATGGYVAETVGIRPVFYLAFVFYGLACLALALIRSQHAYRTRVVPEADYSVARLLRTRRLLILSMFFAALTFIVMMFRPFVPTYLSDIHRSSDFEIGLLGSVLFASSGLIGILLGKYGDKSRKSYPLALSLILGTVSLPLLLLSGNFMVLVISSVLSGGSYLTWSLMSAIVGPLAPEPCRARWIAVPQAVCMFASCAAPYLGGFLYAYAPQYPFIVAIVGLPIFALISLKVLVE